MNASGPDVGPVRQRPLQEVQKGSSFGEECVRLDCRDFAFGMVSRIISWKCLLDV